MLRPAAILTLLAPLHAATLFVTEDFESGFTPWGVAAIHPTPPFILENLGPEGGGDAALIASSSGGTGPGSRLAIFVTNLTSSAWTGDFLDAGITAIRVDLRNADDSNLTIRAAVNGPGGWFISDAAAVTTGSGWNRFTFDLSPSSLTADAANTDSDLAATLGEVTQLRLYHQPADDDHRGAAGNATLRIDNITAIPEPSLPLLALAASPLLARRRRPCMRKYA